VLSFYSNVSALFRHLASPSEELSFEKLYFGTLTCVLHQHNT
jgi:hypothetical protein